MIAPPSRPPFDECATTISRSSRKTSEMGFLGGANPRDKGMSLSLYMWVFLGAFASLDHGASTVEALNSASVLSLRRRLSAPPPPEFLASLYISATADRRVLPNGSTPASLCSSSPAAAVVAAAACGRASRSSPDCSFARPNSSPRANSRSLMVSISR